MKKRALSAALTLGALLILGACSHAGEEGYVKQTKFVPEQCARSFGSAPARSASCIPPHHIETWVKVPVAPAEPDPVLDKDQILKRIETDGPLPVITVIPKN